MQKDVKSSAVAGVLGVFLGAVGGHEWYLGNNKRAITHVCLTVGGLILLVIGVILMNLSRDVPVFNMLFVCLVIAAYVILVGNGVWGFIEGVIILMQGDAGLAAKGYKIAEVAPLGGNNMVQPGVENATATDATAPAAENNAATVPESTQSAVAPDVVGSATQAVNSANTVNSANPLNSESALKANDAVNAAAPAASRTTTVTPAASATSASAAPVPPVIPKAPDFTVSAPVANNAAPETATNTPAATAAASATPTTSTPTTPAATPVQEPAATSTTLADTTTSATAPTVTTAAPATVSAPAPADSVAPKASDAPTVPPATPAA